MCRVDGARRRLITVLRDATDFLDRPDNNFLWSWWEDSEQATGELNRIISALESGQTPPRVDVDVLFAPTGPIQEVSVSSGWGDEFLGLGARFDAASARFYGPSVALHIVRKMLHSGAELVHRLCHR